MRGRNGIRTALAAMVLGLVLGGAAGACPRALPAGAGKAVPAQGIDQRLLNAAVLAEVNFHRCRHGRPALAPARQLTEAARGHSRWMAATGQLSHRSTLPGRQSARQRLTTPGVRFRAFAENIAMVHRMQVDGVRVQILDRARCHFAVAGRRVPPHSYASLARSVVALWMASSGHRRNILNRRVAMAGTAAAFDPGGRYCGRYWLTQDFLG